MWSPVAAVGPTWIQRHLPWAVPVGMLLAIVTALHFLWSLPQEGNAPAAASISAAMNRSPPRSNLTSDPPLQMPSNPQMPPAMGLRKLPHPLPPHPKVRMARSSRPASRTKQAANGRGPRSHRLGDCRSFRRTKMGLSRPHCPSRGGEEPRVAATGEARRSEPAPAVRRREQRPNRPLHPPRKAADPKTREHRRSAQAAAPQPSSPQVPGPRARAPCRAAQSGRACSWLATPPMAKRRFPVLPPRIAGPRAAASSNYVTTARTKRSRSI